MIPVIHPALSRRALLRAVAVAGGVVVLAGCDDLSEDRVVSPTGNVEPDDPATWPADTELLFSARQRVHSYRLGLKVVGVDSSSLATELEELWRTQQERLELLITLGGVPLPDLHDQPVVTLPDPPGDADSSSSSSTASASSAGKQGRPTGDAGSSGDAGSGSTAGAAEPPGAADLGRAVWADHSEACRELSRATPTNLVMLASLASQHVTSAARLGASIAWGPLAGPAGAAAVPVLAATRPAAFGLEVVAARSASADERARYEGILRSLTALTRQLSTLAGEAAPVAPLGYNLPEPLETAQQRLDLARSLVADLAPSALDAAQRVPGDLAQLTGVVRIVSDAARWGARLDVDARPFPGMTLP